MHLFSFLASLPTKYRTRRLTVLFFCILGGVSVAITAFILLRTGVGTDETSQVLSASTTQADLPPPSPTVTDVPTPTPDPRMDKLRAYFAYRTSLNRHVSPLASHAALLIAEADAKGIDYRLVTAIATIESNQCRATPDRDPYNCWGWGIYPGSFKTPFVDHADGIVQVTRGLSKHYHAKGHDTIEEIAAIYNPNTPEAWGAKVQKIYDLISRL